MLGSCCRSAHAAGPACLDSTRKLLAKRLRLRYYAWPEADKLFALSEEISTLQEKVGDTSDVPLLDAYLGYR